MLRQGAEQPRAHPGNPVERRKAAERAVSLPICHHALGECHADPRQPGKLGGGGAVGIDALARGEGARERQYAVAMRER